MYIKINKLKIDLETVEGFWNRLKCLMFVIEPLDHGFLLKKRKHFQTYFACQPIDAIITNKENIILKVYRSCKSEKIFWPVRKGYYTYLLPEGSAQNLKPGDILIIFDDKEDKNGRRNIKQKTKSNNEKISKGR